MIEVQDLVKYYGPTLAVDHLNFEIPEGKIVGFLGPNGAGKSTTIRILTGFLPATQGMAKVAGFDVFKQADAARKLIGYLPETTPLYLEMKVDEYLHFRGKLHGMTRNERRQRIDIVCDRCGLAHNKKRVIGNLSHGNRQRVGLAQALLHDPKVLILDEPTNGFDPNQKHQVRQLISDLRGDHTVLVSTHILPEVEQTADDVIIISNGKIVARGTPTELRQQVGKQSNVLVEVKAAVEAASKAIKGIDGIADVRATTQSDGWCRAVIKPRDGLDVRERLGKTIQSNNWMCREMRHESATLEEFFIQITADEVEG
jgi:ABC-2 type transport system ATP-binding protein